MVAAAGSPTVAPRNFYDPVATNLGDYELKAGMDKTARTRR